MGFIQTIIDQHQKRVQERNDACNDLISHIDDAKTREECQEKLKKLIEEMDREIRLITIAGESSDHRIPDGISQKKKAVMTYLSKHPEEKNKSLIARETGVDRSTVRKYYSEFIRLHETTK